MKYNNVYYELPCSTGSDYFCSLDDFNEMIDGTEVTDLD